MLEELHPHEKMVLVALGELGKTTPQEIAKKSGLKINSVMRALYWLSPRKLIKIIDHHDELVSLGREGETHLKIGLPERRALETLIKKREMDIKDLKDVLDEREVRIAILWLKKKNLGSIAKGRLILNPKAGAGKTDDERLLEILKKGGVKKSELDEKMVKALDLLKGRQDVIKTKERIFREVVLTKRGKNLVDKGIKIEEGIAQLTHKLLKSGEWKKAKFRRYDVKAMAPEMFPARFHPLKAMIRDIRNIFLHMGFKEISGPLIESSFWNFDALFVPQDHPAREMQDTFYLSNPKTARLPGSKLVKAISKAHENGGGTGSIGWRYQWKEKDAKQALLRTHTTASTIRYLAANKKPPIKVFSIGRTFRREKMTFKHIPEFHQIEGIVVGNVNFRELLGILKEFYERMGFEKMRFRPAYFPYTEPSLEVEVFFEDKNGWIELGGAGIFRPEVTLPLGIKYPVLAWGLGLERLAMLKLGLEDIRAFYKSDLDWLRRIAVV